MYVLVLPRALPPDFAEAAVARAALILAPVDPARPEGGWEALKDTIGVERPLAGLTEAAEALKAHIRRTP